MPKINAPTGAFGIDGQSASRLVTISHHSNSDLVINLTPSFPDDYGLRKQIANAVTDYLQRLIDLVAYATAPGSQARAVAAMTDTRHLIVSFSNTDYPFWAGPVNFRLGIADTLAGEVLAIDGEALIETWPEGPAIGLVALDNRSGYELISQAHTLLDNMRTVVQTVAHNSD